MNTEASQLNCSCGHSVATDKAKVYCDKCGRPIFADPKEIWKYRFNHLFVLVMILAVFGFIAYIFIEMIATPLLGN
jgi:hypothetical protein